MDIRCLSLRQPWASLVAMREKLLETRSWRTLWRGPLLIHASGTKPDAEAMERAGIRSALDRCGLLGQPLPHGAILCATSLLDCWRIEMGATWGGQGQQLSSAILRTPAGGMPVSEREWWLGHYEGGRWAWVLDQAQPFSPIPCAGAQGLWRPGPELLGALQARGVRWQHALRHVEAAK